MCIKTATEVVPTTVDSLMGMGGLQNYTDGNLVMSPFAIFLTIASLFGSGGTRGRTGEQIASSLDAYYGAPTYQPNSTPLEDAVKETSTIAAEKLSAMIGDIDGNSCSVREDSMVCIANIALVKRHMQLRSAFSEELKDNFRFQLREVDFSKPMDTANEINQWCYEQTHGKIPQFVSPEEIDPEMRLALLNAIYLKGTWTNPFDKRATKEDSFYINQYESIAVQMMTTVTLLKYISMPDKGFHAIAKPLKHLKYDLMIILPVQRYHLDAIEKVFIRPSNFTDVYNQMDLVNTQLELPKFKLESKVDLLPMMERMGMTDILDPDLADLSGIDGGAENLYVGKALQRAVFEVNEAGIEAAAVTGIFVMNRAAFRPEHIFKVDQPFLFALINSEHEVVLFSGRVTQPAYPVPPEPEKEEPAPLDIPPNVSEPKNPEPLAPELETTFDRKMNVPDDMLE